VAVKAIGGVRVPGRRLLRGRIGVTVLDLSRPVVVAPMAGGPSTPGLAAAAAAAGTVGFLAAGYKTADTVAREVAELRATRLPFGLNIFVPVAPPVDVAPLEEYRRALEPEAERYGVEVPPVRLDDDDQFAAKVRIAVDTAVPLVSFTFGVPEASVVTALRNAGSAVLITVTNVEQARRAATVGPDALVVQAGSAGGHSATTSPCGYNGSSIAPTLVRDSSRWSICRSSRRAGPEPRRTCGACWQRVRSQCKWARCFCLPTRPGRGRCSGRRCCPDGSPKRW